MKKDYWRQLREYAELYDLELLNVTGVRNAWDIEIAGQAIVEIDQALTANGHKLGTSIAVGTGIQVTARRCIKKGTSRRYRN